ncbi:MAG: hypothetical protein QM482_06910 [Sulfurospirillum sp.]
MKKILLTALFISLLFSKSEILSQIPPVKNVFMNLQVEDCNTTCLNALLANGKIFSFLSIYKNHSQFDNIQNKYDKYTALFGINKKDNLNIRLAMLIPQKVIRRYAVSTVDSALAYLLYKKYNFDLKIYNSNDESESSLLNSLAKIRKDGYKYILAPLTEKGAKIVVQNSKGLIVYIPTVNSNKIENPGPNVIFGGINYKQQVDKLLLYATNKIAIFSDDSSIANELNSEVQNSQKLIIYEKKFKNSNINFKKILKWNRKLDNSSIFLNLPLVKASLLASQLRVYDRKPYNLLSTQINYNPMILTLTQYADRKSLLIANSIGNVNEEITMSNNFLGSDIEYNWVNYSTSLGLDILYNRFFLQNENRSFGEEVLNNQVEYNTYIVSPKRYTINTLTDEGM